MRPGRGGRLPAADGAATLSDEIDKLPVAAARGYPDLDIYVAGATRLLLTCMIVFMNCPSDILPAWLDPRIKPGRRRDDRPGPAARAGQYPHEMPGGCASRR